MSTTISSYTSVSTTLNLTAGETLTVTSHGAIVPNSDFAPLVASPTSATPVTIVNAGAIDGFPFGNSGGHYSGIALSLGSGGSVTNSGGIVGYAKSTAAYGIVSNDTLTLVNTFLIAAEGTVATGVSMAAGLVTNSGLITAANYGVVATGEPFTLVNSGTIDGVGKSVASNQVGVWVHNGTVTNVTEGKIVGTIEGGWDGIESNEALTLVNQGYITGGNNAGVAMNTGLIKNNESNGTITGANFGISASGEAAVVNTGMIIGRGDDSQGVALSAGGVVDNAAGGTITADYFGVNAGGPLDLTNEGLITATNADNSSSEGYHEGVAVNMGGGYVLNQGTIVSSHRGIESGSGTLDLVNAYPGTISATFAFGVAVDLMDGTVTNGGTIMATGYGGIGVKVEDKGSLSLVNTGTIAGGPSGQGVYIGTDATAVIDNEQTGTIDCGPGSVGIYNKAGALSLTNAGTVGSLTATNEGILATTTVSPVSLNAPEYDEHNDYDNDNFQTVYPSDAISNQSNGVIAGAYAGIAALGTITVGNAGTIEGGQDGIRTGGTHDTTVLMVNNSGTIEGVGMSGSSGNVSGSSVDPSGIDNYGTLIVQNDKHGVIEAPNYGIQAHGDANTIVNIGTIMGTAQDGVGVQLDNYTYVVPNPEEDYGQGTSYTLLADGTVTNSGLIQGVGDGINSVNDLTLTNSGAIVSMDDDAVSVAAYAMVSNAASGMIDGAKYGVVAGTLLSFGSISLSNAGTITGGIGVAADSVDATNSGLISGVTDGVLAYDLTLTNTNTGTIEASLSPSSDGVAVSVVGSGTVLNDGLISGFYGIVDNDHTGNMLDVTNHGSIYGAVMGISAGTSLELTNTGAITGMSHDGVVLGSGSVTNLANAVISTDGYEGVGAKGALTLVNAGTIDNTVPVGIASNDAGVSLASGTILNDTSGVISGPDGVYVSGKSVTVTNYGTIADASGGDALSAVNADAMVTLEPGATFVGEVTVGAGSTLTLASAATAGTMTTPGQYVGFASVYEQAGANWTITSDVASNLSDITVGTSAALTLDGGLAKSDTINLDPNATLNIEDPANFAGMFNIVNPSQSATINFPTLVQASTTFHAGVTDGQPYVVISTPGPNNSTVDYTIDFSPTLANKIQFVASGDFGLIVEPICFATGTRIATPSGEVAVERLQAGDEVVTASGEVRKVKWVGKRSLHLAVHPHPEKLRPVCIRAHAFGENLPKRDLWVSPGHAIHWQDALIPAERLVNGASVYQADVGFVTYHHVELESHDLLISEGLASESYLDAGNRGNFEGEDGFVLHPDLSAAAEGAAEGCLPRLFEGPVVAAARAHLLSRLPALGFERGEAEAVLGEVWAKGRLLGELKVGENEVIIPAEVENIELRSSTFVPAGLDPSGEDCRVLGVRLLALALDGVAVSLDAPALVRGFHGVEPDGRWTDGMGILAVPPSSRPRTLTLTLAPRPAGWRANTARVQKAA